MYHKQANYALQQTKEAEHHTQQIAALETGVLVCRPLSVSITNHAIVNYKEQHDDFKLKPSSHL